MTHENALYLALAIGTFSFFALTLAYAITTTHK